VSHAHHRIDAAHTLWQIVPPGQGGVLDFALLLQTAWAQLGAASGLLTLDAQSAAATPLRQSLMPHIGTVRQHACGTPHCAVLLHFSGYGYQSRGLCFWLLRQLRELRAAHQQQGSQLQLVVMFHELFASSPPWRSAFWLKPFQAAIARQIARSADALWTNSEHHASWLQQQRRSTAVEAAPVHVQPVFSTMSEPATVTKLSMRSPSLVVFGSQPTRQRALDLLTPHLSRLRAWGIEELLEVGSGTACASKKTLPGHRFVGRLTPAQLSVLLQSQRFALIDYPSVHLGKSTVFAAYAAHGCVVLNTAPPGPDADALQQGKHYLNLSQCRALELTTPFQNDIAAAARQWYATHTLAQQAALFLRILLPESRPVNAEVQTAAASRLLVEASRG
jgi:hypothetical protein